MKNILFLAATFICVTLMVYSQHKSGNLYPIESHGIRIIGDLNGTYENNTLGDTNSYYWDNFFNLHSSASISLWRYGKKFNYVGVLSGTENYRDDTTDNSSQKHRAIYGNLYTSIDYYINPYKFYINGSYELFMQYIFDKQVYKWMVAPDSFDYFQSEYEAGCFGHFLWAAAGYGRLINTAREIKLDNFEKILFKDKIITKPLNQNVKDKLVKLIERRNNRDYQAKYKDNDEIKFFSDLEKMLIDEGIVSQPLGAAIVMKFYQALTNTKFVYYPDFTGWQSQLEVQYNPTDKGSVNDFITLSSVYAFKPGQNTNTILTGFISSPLRAAAYENNLYQGIRNPFSSMLPIIAENFGLDVYHPSFYGDYQGFQYYTDLDYVLGMKAQMFHSFTNTIGIDAWGQAVALKTKESSYRNTTKLGLQVDFNLISIINLSAGIAWFRNNSGFQQLSSNFGTKIIFF